MEIQAIHTEKDYLVVLREIENFGMRHQSHWKVIVLSF